MVSLGREPMSTLGERAVVCGGGMGGLLAARVLSEFYRTVTLVERDVLPNSPAQRRGVPQGRHFHALLAGGAQALDRLFPGLLDELAATGATVCDDGNLSRVSIRVRGRELNRSGRFADPAAAIFYLVSRPFLESHVRRRVRDIDNIQILDGHDVVAPITAGTRRITGARVADHQTGTETALEADLVVDAMGRGARTPALVDSLGYGRPVEHRGLLPTSYSSQLLRVPADAIAERLIFVFPEKNRPTGGALSAYENGTWMLSVGCADGCRPPDDLPGIIDTFGQFAPPEVAATLRAGEPLGGVSHHHHPGGVWRRYDKMPHFPAGLLVFGDAICSFNPVYGQGMTVAALEAIALRDCLSHGDADLSRRFFNAATRWIRFAWGANQANDRYVSKCNGRRSISQQLTDWRIGKTLDAAANNPVATEKLVRVTQFIDPPSALLPSWTRRWLPGLTLA